MRIGDYEVVRELGRGGMGVVYAVSSSQLPGLRALKLLQRSADAQSQLRFRREAETLARIRHPGIVRIHEVGEDEGGLFLVMDLVEGEPVDHVLRRGPVEFERARDWVLQLAEAVAAMHSAGILHRDLKPANLMLCPDGRILLLDFGLARRDGRTSLTQTGAITGSPGYMSPEQADGLKDLTPAVDVHGLGAVLFALVTGDAPFRGPTVLAGLQNVLESDVEWPGAVPAGLARVGARALAKRPEDRYQHAGEFAAALRGSDAAAGASARRAGGVVALGLALVALAGGWALWALRVTPNKAPASAKPLTRASAPAATPFVISKAPREPSARIEWYRRAWHEAGLRVLEPAQRRLLVRVQESPFFSLEAAKDEAPQSFFWGRDRWVRHRATGLDWGRLDQGALVLGHFPFGAGYGHAEGESLWIQASRSWSLWHSPGAGATPAELRVQAPSLDSAERLTLVLATQGERLAIASQSEVWELDRASGATTSLLRDDYNEIVELRYTHGGALLARAKSGGTSRIIPVLSPLRGLTTVRRSDAMAAHPSLEVVAVGHNGSGVALWEVGAELSTVQYLESDAGSLSHVKGVAYGPRGGLIYAVLQREGSRTGELRVWRLDSGAWYRSRTQVLSFQPFSLDISADGALLLISGLNGKSELWPAGDRAR